MKFIKATTNQSSTHIKCKQDKNIFCYVKKDVFVLFVLLVIFNWYRFDGL